MLLLLSWKLKAESLLLSLIDVGALLEVKMVENVYYL